ncbi:MAG: MmgE/PrpD family protein [Gammaproteobacteria bacterium]|nr:MmgE/PrpD family protein [Gammaproteobacteria bacterium]
MTIAQTLATFLTETRYDDLPELPLEHAAMIVASTLASAACGTDIESARIVRDLARAQGGRSDASLWFDKGTKLPIASAARVNAMMSDAAASDDSDLRNIVHAGTPLTAVSLAVAEHTGADGQQILAAIVLGYEAAGRIAGAITPGFNHKGFHGCLGAIFAAGTAGARLLGLDALQTAHTIALCATSMGGLMAAANTSVAREYHAGLAALLGLEAAQAARAGYTAELGILEAERGFCAVFGDSDAGTIVHDLGHEWDIVTDMAIKLVPGGHPYHALGEAAANAARAGNVDPQAVQAIIISRPGMHTLSEPLHPVDLIDMAHSPAYFVAAGTADRTFGWEHASPQKIADPIIHRLIDKVRVEAPPTEDVAAYRQGATVTIQTVSGQRFSSTVHVPKGAGCLGIEWADIDAKYRTLTPRAPLSAGQVEASLSCIHHLDRIQNVRELLDLLLD